MVLYETGSKFRSDWPAPDPARCDIGIELSCSKRHRMWLKAKKEPHLRQCKMPAARFFKAVARGHVLYYVRVCKFHCTYLGITKRRSEMLMQYEEISGAEYAVDRYRSSQSVAEAVSQSVPQ